MDRDDPQTTVDSLAAGADDVFHETDDFEILNARIRSQVRRKQIDDEKRRIRDELVSRELAAEKAPGRTATGRGPGRAHRGTGTPQRGAGGVQLLRPARPAGTVIPSTN
jgi:DNA-binding response OmpR family regulator